jgi:predicted transcriptional regulator
VAVTLIRGELQAEIMAAMWRLGSGTVDQVRAALPPRRRGAYTTVQTVLNRLAERGLLAREREGQAIVYAPRMSEADYLSRAIAGTLAGGSPPARQAALAQLVGELERDELEELGRLAREVAAKRAR